MATHKKKYTGDKDFSIRLKPREISDEEIKKSWDAIYEVITQLDEDKSGSSKKLPSES